jgi:hypothetical protein
MIGLDRSRVHPQVIFAVIGEKKRFSLSSTQNTEKAFDQSISSAIVAFWDGRGAAFSSSAVKNYTE